MKNYLLIGLGALAIFACAQETNEPIEISKFYYGCNNASKQTMTWVFQGAGDVGYFELEGGSVLKPIDATQSKTAFTRQDGTEFMVTGSAEKWTLKNLSTGNSLDCLRKTGKYSDVSDGNVNFQATPEVPVMVEN